MTSRIRRGGIAALGAWLWCTAALPAVAESGYLPGLGGGLIDGDGQPSLIFSLMPYDGTEETGTTLASRYTVAVQRFSPSFEGSAPNSDAAVNAAAVRAYRLWTLGDSAWYFGLGAGFRHRLLIESWVSLDDENIAAQINRGDLYGHAGLSYAWQRESSLIWLDVLGLQLRLAELYRSDNLDDHNVLAFWKNQLRGNFHRDADQRLRLALIAVTFVPTD